MRGILIAAGLATATPCAAVDGYLDTAFGALGLGSTRLVGTTPVPRDTAVLADGRILVAAEVQQNSTGEVDAGVIRFNADGSIDDTFSFDGNVLTNYGGNTTLVQDEPHAMAVQGDGKILLCGGTGEADGSDARDFGITRLNSDGSLDTSFGSGTGKERVAFDLQVNADDDVCFAIATQPDGKIVVAGKANASSGLNYDFAVARLNSDGSLDTTFNGTGKQTVAFDFSGSTDDDEAWSVAIDSDGGILVGGIADHGSGGTQRDDMAIARLTANGLPDDNFNTDGKVTTTFNLGGADASGVEQLLIQPDHKIVAVGLVSQDTAQTYWAFAAARFFPDGSPDTGFGPNANGRARIKFNIVPNSIDFAFGGVLQSDGKLVLGGLAQNGTSPVTSAAAFARLTAGGLLDSTFGNGGKAYDTLSLGSTTTQVAIKPKLQGGRVVAAVGPFDHSEGSYIGVVRLESDLIYDGGFD